MRIILSPGACATDSSTLKSLIKSVCAFGMRYIVQTRNGLLIGKINSDHKVSMCALFNSGRRKQLSEFLEYKTRPRPDLFSIFPQQLQTIDEHLTVWDALLQNRFTYSSMSEQRSVAIA